MTEKETKYVASIDLDHDIDSHDLVMIIEGLKKKGFVVDVNPNPKQDESNLYVEKVRET